jgi:hypothetical protein
MRKRLDENNIEQCVRIAKQELLDRFLREPREFFTEYDLTAFFAHRLHLQLERMGSARMLVHLEYPTPFRCDTSNGGFVLRTESERKGGRRRFGRGHYDVVVFNPTFLDECGEDYILRKGQKWELLRPFLAGRDGSSAPAAFWIFEFMFLRDPFWRREDLSRGRKTLADVVVAVEQDWAKVQAATSTNALGYQFARRAEMLIFDCGLAVHAAAELLRQVPQGVQVVSVALSEQTRASTGDS